MMKSLKKSILLCLATVLVITAIPFSQPAAVQAATKYCKVNTFLRYLAVHLELEVDGSEYKDYRAALYKAGILVKGDFTTYAGKNITRTDCALLLSRTLDYLEEAPDESAMNKIKTFHRIRDLSKISEAKQEAVVRVFSEGIIIGFSNGKYTQDRNFKGKDYISNGGAANWVKATLDSKKRSPMSPDGQLIRTTKLPKNAKKFDYILANFPNDFYEKKFWYQKTTYSVEPKEFEHYVAPARMKKDEFRVYYDFGKYDAIPWEEFIEKKGAQWFKKIEDNLKLRLNFDYRTVDNKWISELRSTYFLFGDSNDNDLTKKIKRYVATAKKNKVIVTAAQISVEPSTLYYSRSLGYYVRCYVKFKVSANTVYAAETGRQGELIFPERRDPDIYMKGLQKNKWISTYIDIGLATANGFSDGTDYAVSEDWIFN